MASEVVLECNARSPAKELPAIVRRWNIAFLLDPVNANAHQETFSMDSTVGAA
jgi:hypothetical protein